jgi:NADPH-dependent ferric siderophore reductase
VASAKAIFGAALGRLFFRDATVMSVRDLGARFRLVEMAGPALRGVSWTPGDKVQVFLSGEGMRTYTPLRWDAGSGTTAFLIYVHDAYGPGARWARALASGQPCQLFGPRGSIAFPDLAERVVLVGDETSFAAGRALADARSSACVFEVTDASEAREVLGAVGLEAALVERRAGDAHLDELAGAVRAQPSSSVVLTGRAQTIQALRARGVKGAKTKAYWSVGKSGLD